MAKQFTVNFPLLTKESTALYREQQNNEIMVEPETPKVFKEKDSTSFKSNKSFHLNSKILWPEPIVWLHENPVVKEEPFLTAA